MESTYLSPLLNTTNAITSRLLSSLTSTLLQLFQLVGTVTFTATDDGFNYGTMTNGSVSASSPEYARPNLSGKINKVKATTAGIVGATHFTAVINSFN